MQTPTQNTLISEVVREYSIPSDIEGLAAALDRLIEIYQPCILNKYHSLAVSDRVEATKILNNILEAFKQKWSVSWSTNFEINPLKNWFNCADSHFPEAVQLAMAKYISHKEVFLVRALNQSSLNLCLTQSYLNNPPADFLVGDSDPSRLHNWMLHKPTVRLSLSARYLQMEHNKDVEEVRALSSHLFKAAWTRAVGPIAHMRRLWSQISVSCSRVVRRPLVAGSATTASVGTLQKSVSAESAAALHAELAAAENADAKENLMKHCNLDLGGAVLCLLIVY